MERQILSSENPLDYSIVTLSETSQEIEEQIKSLLVQLNPDYKGERIHESVESILQNPHQDLIVAKVGEEIKGLAILSRYTILLGDGEDKAQIEDVVIDSGYRGKGIGESLIKALLTVAKEKNVGIVYLTSQPKSVAANKLYQKLGFELHDTNCYRKILK